MIENLNFVRVKLKVVLSWLKTSKTDPIYRLNLVKYASIDTMQEHYPSSINTVGLHQMAP